MAPMSEDEHNVEHILYVESPNEALPAKHKADEFMVAGDYASSIVELGVCIEALGQRDIEGEMFSALRHAAAFLRNTRAFNLLRLGRYDEAYADGLKCIELDVEGGAWHRVIRASEERLPIEAIIKEEAELEAERLEQEKASMVIPEALPRTSKRGGGAVEAYFTELGLAAKQAGEAEFKRRAYGRAHRHYSEALCEAKLDEGSHPVRRAHAMLRCNRALCCLQMCVHTPPPPPWTIDRCT